MIPRDTATHLRSSAGYLAAACPAGTSTFSYTYDPASLPLTESTTAFGRTWTVVNEYSKTNESWVISSGAQKYYLSFAGAGGLSNLWAPGIGFELVCAEKA